MKCFASAREVLGRSEFRMTVDDGTTIELLDRQIRALSSQLDEMPFMLALNKQYPERGTVVKEGDEVAIIPPVSGG